VGSGVGLPDRDPTHVCKGGLDLLHPVGWAVQGEGGEVDGTEGDVPLIAARHVGIAQLCPRVASHLDGFVDLRHAPNSLGGLRTNLCAMPLYSFF